MSNNLALQAIFQNTYIKIKQGLILLTIKSEPSLIAHHHPDVRLKYLSSCSFGRLCTIQ